MIIKISEQLYKELVQDIENLRNNQDKPESPGIYLDLINGSISKLKGQVLLNGFESPEEEILFFKTVKPKFVSLLLYYLKIYFIELKKPGGSTKVVRKYYEQELELIRKFFDYNQNICHYYRSCSADLDDKLFIRNVKDYPRWLIKLRIDSDERFSTAADHIFARMMAFEQTNDFLLKAVFALDHQPNKQEGETAVHNLKWTGEAINLIEVAYGWYFTGQINNGNAGIAEIVRLLEKVFNISIGRPYRRFTEIKQRKRLSKTQYLDEMKISITKKLYDEDEFKSEFNMDKKGR